MRNIKDENGVLLEEGHIIIYPSLSILKKAQVLKICKNTVKVSTCKFKGLHNYVWEVKEWNVENHNSFCYIYIPDFIIVGKDVIKDTSVLKLNPYK